MTADITKSPTTDKMPSEIELLKTQADILGLQYKGNISAKALRKQIMDVLLASVEDEDTGQSNDSRVELEKESSKLIRAIVMPVAAHMRDYQGQVFSVGNSVINTISKYIMFNTEFHVPNIILKHIQAQQMQYFVTNRVNGREVRESKMANAYNVTILPTLTKEELIELGRSQENRNAIDA